MNQLTKENSKPADKTTLGKISVNLLPEEIVLQRKQSSKLLFINKMSVVFLIALVFFASATLALRLSQNIQLENSMEVLARSQSRVTSLKGKEEQVIVLKQRLNSIQNLMGGDIKRRAIFNLIVFLTPPDIQISEMSVDRNGNMGVSFTSSTLSSVDTLISDLGNKEKNLDLISKVDLEGLTLSKDNAFRFALKITGKK